MNNVQLYGNISTDIELKEGINGEPKVRFCVAVNCSDSEQNTDKKTDFVPCKAYGKKAELLAEWFEKGDKILVEGKWSADNYIDANGEKKIAHNMVISKFHFLKPHPNNTEYQNSENTWQEDDSVATEECIFEFNSSDDFGY